MSVRLVARSVWANPGNRGRRLRRTWHALAWQVWKRAVRRPRLLTLASGARFRAYPDCVVSSALVYADWPEYRELVFVRRNLERETRVVDVGANVGHISLLLADIADAADSVAFEPTPASYRRLVENWGLNGWPSALLFRAAVGAESGTVFVADVASPVSTNRTTARRPLEGAFIEVPCVRLDDFDALWKSRPVGFLKVDVEGGEQEVFLGARGLLETFRPRLVMFESLGGRVAPGVAKLFAEAGYVVFGLDRDGRPRADDLSGQNLFAAPTEERSRLR